MFHGLSHYFNFNNKKNALIKYSMLFFLKSQAINGESKLFLQMKDLLISEKDLKLNGEELKIFKNLLIFLEYLILILFMQLVLSVELCQKKVLSKWHN